MKMEIVLEKEEFQKIVTENIIGIDPIGTSGSVLSDGSISIALESIPLTKDELAEYILDYFEIPADSLKVEKVEFAPVGNVGIVFIQDKK
jgi:hypothetical protein